MINTKLKNTILIMQKLLLLHGALGSTKQLFPLYEALRNDFEIYLLNFIGHGGEEIPGEVFSIRLFSQDVMKFLEKAKIESISIFGYSMGGYVALYLARHYPYLVDKVFTFATKFEWSEETAKKETKMLDPQKIEEKVPKFAEELKHRHEPQDWKKVLQKTSEMMMNLGKQKELGDDDIKKIKHNVLVGVGDKDNMVSVEETFDVYKNLSSGNLLVMPGVIHPIEKIPAQRLANEVKNFFLS
jgi:esterase/lipase